MLTPDASLAEPLQARCCSVRETTSNVEQIKIRDTVATRGRRGKIVGWVVNVRRQARQAGLASLA